MADIKESLVQLSYPAGPWIEETRVKLGQGHYGTVYGVKIRGLQCAGKKYDLNLLEEPSGQDVGSSGSGKRFVEQCLQLAQVRHPNVVQLLGVYFDSKSAPTVVSELLPLNLAKCLEEYHHIPKYAKSSILLDVANGLRYVHEQKRPMVHGRLSAEKILLTISLQAKICGFVNPSGAVLPDSSYTPPEAGESCSLTVKGDVFSFGNLVLHVVSQNYPKLTGKETQDPGNPDQTVTRSSVDRREQSLKELGESHSLQGLVKQCLEDDPSSRPASHEVLKEVEQYAVSTPPPYASVLQVMQEVEQATLLKDNIAALTQSIEGKQAELDAKQLEVDGLMQELEVKEKAVVACKEELDAYKQTVQSKERRLLMHDQALRAKDSLIKAKAREIVAKNQQLTAKDSQLAASNRRIGALEERLATGKSPTHKLRFSATPPRSATTRSQQVSPTFKESPFKFSQSAEAEDLATKAGEVLRRSVPGRRGKPVPMSDGIFFHNARFEPQKSGIYGQQQVDPKLAAILAKRHQQYEEVSAAETPKHLEPSQQTKGRDATTNSTSDQVQLRNQQEQKQQQSHSGSANSDMSPELQKMMEKRRTVADKEPAKPPPTLPRKRELHTSQREQEPPTSQQEPEVPASQQQEPEAPTSQQQEPEAPTSQQQEPDVPTSQQQEQDVPASQQQEPEVPASQQQEPEVPTSQQQEPEAPTSQQQEPEAPTSQQQEPEVPASQQQEPEVPASQQQEPEAPTSQQQEPEVPASQQQEQDVPTSQQQEPEGPTSQQQEPDVPTSQQQEPESPSTAPGVESTV